MFADQVADSSGAGSGSRSSGSPQGTPPVVPGYTLDRLLGRGGSGEVWRAVPRAGGPAVAVKVLIEGDGERQAREAALLRELDHPHLVRLHEVVHQPRRGSAPRVALVLDLLAGGSLGDLLVRRGRLRPGEVVTAIAPIAAALAHAHERGVVHGDLSPSNILFTSEGRPVLTDLGVASVLGESLAVAVTPPYVDPTVARGGAPGPASDVFGVAAAAFHALTGIPPWNGATPADALAVAATGQLPDLSELAPEAPPELVAVIGRGLAADPGERGSTAAFALDLRHACRPEPVALAASSLEEGAQFREVPRTELTHQLRRRAPAQPVEAARRGRLRGIAGRPAESPTGRHHRPASPPRPGRLRVSYRARTVGGAAVLLLLASLAAALWAGYSRPPQGIRELVAGPARPAGATSPTAASPAATPPAATPAPSSSALSADRRETPASAEDWHRVVDLLYQRRGQAYGTGAGGLLGGVYTSGSSELLADEQHLGALAASGRLLRGFTPTAGPVQAVHSAGDQAELTLVDSWPPYDVVGAGDPEGPVLARGPARPPAQVRLSLVRTPAGWRIEHAERIG